MSHSDTKFPSHQALWTIRAGYFLGPEIHKIGKTGPLGALSGSFTSEPHFRFNFNILRDITSGSLRLRGGADLAANFFGQTTRPDPIRNFAITHLTGISTGPRLELDIRDIYQVDKQLGLSGPESIGVYGTVGYACGVSPAFHGQEGLLTTTGLDFNLLNVHFRNILVFGANMFFQNQFVIGAKNNNAGITVGGGMTISIPLRK